MVNFSKDIKYGALRFKPGQQISPDKRRYSWLCDCGREKEILLSNVISGKTKSCARCSHMILFDGMQILVKSGGL